MTASPGKRDVQRNTAYFLGAAGVAAGVFGGFFAALGIAVWLAPESAKNAPDWLIGLALILMIVLMGGGWPMLDILVNRRPDVGGAVMAALAALFVVVGLVAALRTPVGWIGWFAVLGGVLLLPASYLALAGGGTEPLTWRSLRTPTARTSCARPGSTASTARTSPPPC